jgi:hypothetical protein
LNARVMLYFMALLISTKSTINSSYKNLTGNSAGYTAWAERGCFPCYVHHDQYPAMISTK